MTALAIGNGQSRQRIKLNRLLPDVTSVGCNAICRDHRVDHLVCVDKRMVKEALSSSFQPEKIYTRTDWLKYFSTCHGILAVPDLPYTGTARADNPFHWGSGPYAVLIAAMLNPNKVRLIGFDLHSKDQYVNNVYKDTENYLHSQARPVDPSYWIHQIKKVFECFPDTHFEIINDDDWQMPEHWKLDNVSFFSIEDLAINLNPQLTHS